MKAIRLIVFLTILFQSLSASATIFNYSVTGSGMYRNTSGVPYQSTDVWGNIQISDNVGQLGYGGGPSYALTHFDLNFSSGQNFAGTGSFLFSDLSNSSWISTWILSGAGDWSGWYADSIGYTPLFYHDDGTPYSHGPEYNVLASYIELGNLFTTFDSNGTQNFPGTFLLDTVSDPTQLLKLTRTGTAPVPEPGTLILVVLGIGLAAGARKLRKPKLAS